jgi:hypothetical protein
VFRDVPIVSNIDPNRSIERRTDPAAPRLLA